MNVTIKYMDGTEETVQADEVHAGNASLGLMGDGTFAGRRVARFIPYDRIKEYVVER